mmetsp:Transcript_164910/g.316655  ORF Transcript_164910/g.316655 Transcript_164910/m.316655 type:complete len:568 (-) Transcript_164910:104-1807(-)
MAAKVSSPDRERRMRIRAKRTRRIPADVCNRLQREFKIALRGMNAKDVFRKFDKDKSGELNTEELISLIRLKLRVTPDALTNEDIGAIVAALDDDQTGYISLDELLDFVERGAAAFEPEIKKKTSDGPVVEKTVATRKIQLRPPDRYAWLQGEVLQGKENTRMIAQVEMMSPEVCNCLIATLGLNPAAVYGSFFGSPFIEVKEQEDGKRPRTIDEDLSRRLQVQLKGATLNKSLEAILKKYGKDRSGRLTYEELRRLIRLELRLPDRVLSDRDINALVVAFDDDGSGTLSIAELIDFVEEGSEPFFADTSISTVSSIQAAPREAMPNYQNGPAHMFPRKSAVLSGPNRPFAPNSSQSSAGSVRPRWQKARSKQTSDWDGAVVVFPVRDDIVVTSPDIKKRIPSEVPSHVVSPQSRPASAFDFNETRLMSPEPPRPQSSAGIMQNTMWSTQPRMQTSYGTGRAHSVEGVWSNQSRMPISQGTARPHSVEAQARMPISPGTARPHSSAGMYPNQSSMSNSQNTARPHSAGLHMRGFRSPTSPTAPCESRPASGKSSPLSSRITRPGWVS